MIKIKKFPYKEMRDGQKIVLDKLQDNWDKYRYFVLELPTGFGKSAIAKTICSSHRDAFLVTATKQLQDQYLRDFPNENIVSIKGKNNYACYYNEKLTCECGPCLVNKDLLKECRLFRTCPYYSTRDDAMAANTALTSYQYFLRAMDCAGFWKKRDVLILDECHLLEQQVTQWASMFLSPVELHTKYQIFENADAATFMVYSVAPDESGFEANKKWLSKIWELIRAKRFELYEDIKASLNGKEPDQITEDELDELASTHKEYYELDKFYKRLDVFFQLSEEEKKNWLIEPVNGGIMMTPVSIGNLFKFYMDSWGREKIIFMSATILDTAGFCKELGLPKEETAIIRMEPTFPPEKSPVVYMPVGYMKYDKIEETIPKIIESVKIILKKHPNEKGIIHTGNYRIAKAICDNIDDDRLIMKEDDGSNEKLLKKHSKSLKATVMVSPSLTTGADLKDDLSRFQIIVKLPWPSLADKRVQKKIELDENWYAAEMFRTLVQACGRSTRSEDDWSVTYVLDTSFFYWVNKFRKWFSKQFQRRIIWKKDDYFID